MTQNAQVTIALPPAECTGLQTDLVTSVLDWKYQFSSEKIMSLYERSQEQPWRAADLDWTIDVDAERLFAESRKMLSADDVNALLEPPRKLDKGEVHKLHNHIAAFMLSQFLHGEQGALLASARLVQTVPTQDAKWFAATQAMDEARHVEVYHRYLTQKFRTSYAIHGSLADLIRDVISAKEWDITYLGMQIVVEGLAMAAFSMMRVILPDEPLIADITRRVMRDEARHVAFGVVALQDLYGSGLSSRELQEREDFIIAAIRLMYERLLMQPVFEALDWDVGLWMRWMQRTVFMRTFRQMLFSKIVPNLRKINLLTPKVHDALTALDLSRHADADEALQFHGIAAPLELWKAMRPLAAKSSRTR